MGLTFSSQNNNAPFPLELNKSKRYAVMACPQDGGEITSAQGLLEGRI